ncbi:alpha/beta hydrolase [uncultured Phenylobacterium sp.]|uniref:alpha/beta fold hydrolase n=1 Tax=uncultured Phenylobacterium sp. TaxID=349273 RepID=UPI0025FFF407|nr:alpha/beta hydrolase [uncultured Phenylobacterium sp.]
MNRREILASTLAAGTVAAIAPPRPAAAAPGRPVSIRAKDSTTLFHRDWGEGRPVVFVSSWAMTSEMWAYQVAHLADDGFRCIAFDRRGHGRSDAPAGGYDLDTLADDLGAVIDGLGLKEVDIVSHSMGGAETARYLGRHGTGRVRRVAMLAPAGPCMVQRPDNAYGAPQAFFDGWIGEWKTDFAKWARDNQAPFFTPSTSPAMQDWLVDQMLSTPAPVAIATFRALMEADVRGDLAKIDRPTLILHGDNDASAPLDISGRRYTAGVRRARLKVYPGAPHGLFVTHMDEVNRDLEAFLKA